MRHFNPFIRNYYGGKDKLLGEFTTLKDGVKAYKVMGCNHTAHYLAVNEKGMPPLLITPSSRHFIAAKVDHIPKPVLKRDQK